MLRWKIPRSADIDMASSKSPDRAEDPIARSALGKDRTGISDLKAKLHCGAGPSAMDLAVEFPHRASFDGRGAGTPNFSAVSATARVASEKKVQDTGQSSVGSRRLLKLAERHIWVVHIAY
jgi:hypothetical protein